MPTNDKQFAELYDLYCQNVTVGMLEVLAEEWDVSVKTLERMRIGYRFTDQCWVFAERDSRGQIIGLVRRFRDGKKVMIEGSKRGLTYILNAEYGPSTKRYSPGRHNWTRVTPDNPCPVCSRTKWCMVSSKNPDNPAAVMCGNEAGSVRPCGEGTFLHILTHEGNLEDKKATVLEPTEQPILIVEGQSDVAAATELGFAAIGKPSATGGKKYLMSMPIHGQKVVVMGEHDSGIGETGMEETFMSLRSVTQHITKLMPPAAVKDLRSWLHDGLTQEQLLIAIETKGMADVDEQILGDDIAQNIAERYLKEHNMLDGLSTLRKYRGKWYQYSEGCYRPVEEEVVRGALYSYLKGKQYMKTGKDGSTCIEPYKATRAKVSDIFDALNQWVPIQNAPPVWLDNGDHPAPRNLIAFKNGLLDIEDYANGITKLYPATPALFSFNVLPYDYREDAHSTLWEDFIGEIFNGNQAEIRLLQEWFGYNLVADLSHEKMMLFTGTPRSGKSTTLDTMCAMIGQSNYGCTNFQSLCGDFGYAPLVGKLAAVIGDAKTPRKSESDSALEKLLMITGGDEVTVNKKNVAQVASEQLVCRFTLVMNDLPAFTDNARALEPRMNMLQFNNSYVGREDRSLKIKLKEAARRGDLINFALEGLKRLRINKKFTEPENSLKMLHEFQEVSTPSIAFVRDCCTEEANATVDKDMLYAAWKGWCNDNNQSHGSKSWFGRNLRSSYPTLTETRVRRQGDRIYCYEGIALTQYGKDFIR